MKFIITVFAFVIYCHLCIGQSKTKRQEAKTEPLEITIVNDNEVFSHSENSVAMSVAPKNLQGYKVYRTISEALKFPKEVFILDLSSQSLTQIPEEIKILSKLKSLDLSFNHIKEIPEWISELDSLIQLDCESNDLCTIPFTFLKMKNLTHLNLGMNKLTELPKDIGDLSSLIVFECTNNKLKELPNSIGDAFAILNAALTSACSTTPQLVQ